MSDERMRNRQHAAQAQSDEHIGSSLPMGVLAILRVEDNVSGTCSRVEDQWCPFHLYILKCESYRGQLSR